MPCRELVEVITDYLDDALPQRDRLRFEAHLTECDACREIAQGRDMDVLEIDAATNTQVDKIRDIIISGLGTAPVLVVEPTNTWHAYDVLDGDSWYLNSNVHIIDLSHPFAGYDVRGDRVPAGLPEQFWKLDLGFLRWYWPSGFRADFFSDDDL